MARLPRSVVAGYPHLVVHRGLSGQDVFRDDADRRAYLQALAQAARDAGVALHGYGLGRHEVRLLLTPATASALSTMMQGIGRRYVRAYNLRHGCRGTPWEGRFRSTVIDAPEWFMRCLAYVEFCAAAGDDGGELSAEGGFPWSSTRHHLGLRIDEWITEHALFWALGNTPFEREAAYKRMLEHPLSPKLVERLRGAALKGWALGSPDFAQSIAELTGRRHEPLARGRPALKPSASSADL